MTATRIITDENLYTEDPTYGTKQYDYKTASSIHSRGFAKILGGGKLGFYHLAAFEPELEVVDWDPWSHEGRWSHELGLFMSYDGGW